MLQLQQQQQQQSVKQLRYILLLYCISVQPRPAEKVRKARFFDLTTKYYCTLDRDCDTRAVW